MSNPESPFSNSGGFDFVVPYDVMASLEAVADVDLPVAMAHLNEEMSRVEALGGARNNNETLYVYYEESEEVVAWVKTATATSFGKVHRIIANRESSTLNSGLYLYIDDYIFLPGFDSLMLQKSWQFKNNPGLSWTAHSTAGPALYRSNGHLTSFCGSEYKPWYPDSKPDKTLLDKVDTRLRANLLAKQLSRLTISSQVPYLLSE